MKQALIALALVLSVTSCLTPRVRDNTLLPAIQSAWEGVREDVEYAAQDGPIASDLEAWDLAVETGNFLSLNVELLVSDALAGVQFQLDDGLLGPTGAQVLMDRAEAFGRAVNEYMRVNTLVRYDAPRRVVQETPLVISRSSWATSPPSAIAGEVYR